MLLLNILIIVLQVSLHIASGRVFYLFDLLTSILNSEIQLSQYYALIVLHVEHVASTVARIRFCLIIIIIRPMIAVN